MPRANDPAGGGPEVAIRLSGITKRFPGVVANDSVSLEIRNGEIHCLLGENGAGKSTLIDILAGIQQPDEGVIEIDGEPTALRSPAASIERGIGVVYQHSSLLPTLSVLENLMLGGGQGFWLDRAEARSRLAELSALLGAAIDPEGLVGDLGLGQQQQVEIARAMWRRPRVLVLDEPTSMLTPQAARDLAQSLRRLQAAGVAIVFVSHKLHEAYALGDTVTVLREGRVTGRIGPREMRVLDEDEAKRRILEAMFGPGAAPSPGAQHEDRPTPERHAAPTVLRAEGLCTVADSAEVPIQDVGFEIASGEVLGVAGIDGHGQRHLAEAIAGQRMPSHGRIAFDGADITRKGVKDRQRLGIRYVPDDRVNEGIVGGLSIALNLVLKKIGERPFWRYGWMDRAAVRAEAEARIADFGIRAPGPDTRAGTLSGGNVQKLLLARELAHAPRAVVFHKPTYGLDLRTVARVHAAIRDFASGGGAALLISTDLDELAELADRVLVLSDGRIVGEVARGERTVERIGALIAGSGARPAPAEGPRGRGEP